MNSPGEARWAVGQFHGCYGFLCNAPCLLASHHTHTLTHPPIHPPHPLAHLQCFPTEGPAVLGPALQRLLAASLLSQGESGLVVAATLGIFARVLLHNGAYYLQFFEAAAAAQQPRECLALWYCALVEQAA